MRIALFDSISFLTYYDHRVDTLGSIIECDDVYLAMVISDINAHDIRIDDYLGRLSSPELFVLALVHDWYHSLDINAHVVRTDVTTLELSLTQCVDGHWFKVDLRILQ